ncbi:probable polygalacturonase [Rosa rugosa]|uniref:probable polygalacturonase n=1 Tax=Rosa rugosa TaxID=74645 RepID=UPI002B40121C|nr:probable polygalacturonase [Rosa rugosa]
MRSLLLIHVVVCLLLIGGGDSRKVFKLSEEKFESESSFEYNAISCRAHSASLTDFGGVGDGKTSNTKAFQAAINHLSQYSTQGGAQLYVPAGKYLTRSFNLTSHFTLYLHKEAVLLASQDPQEWPVLKPLPSYGRGRDAAGGRYTSLIFGTNLTDVIITGDNGTIDGQGEFWWNKFHSQKLQYTRPYLIEIMFSSNVQISHLTLLNSPSWNVHPIYSSNILVQGLTIIAPVRSPNTDGINPDSCTNVKIEDCYIVSGDDCVAVKSGWDQYGVSFGMPTKQLVIRRLTCVSPYSAAIALGSEMSGGIEDVRAEDIAAVDTESGVRIKTAVGRGGYVRDVYLRRMEMHTMRWAFWMSGDYGSHADDGYDKKAFPEIKGIHYRDVVADNVTMVAKLEGIAGHPFTGICMSNVTVGLGAKAKKQPWSCADIEGVASGVTPTPCDLLHGGDPSQGDVASGGCDFPVDVVPIDMVEMKRCRYDSRMKSPPSSPSPSRSPSSSDQDPADKDPAPSPSSLGGHELEHYYSTPPKPADSVTSESPSTSSAGPDAPYYDIHGRRSSSKGKPKKWKPKRSPPPPPSPAAPAPLPPKNNASAAAEMGTVWTRFGFAFGCVLLAIMNNHMY